MIIYLLIMLCIKHVDQDMCFWFVGIQCIRVALCGVCPKNNLLCAMVFYAGRYLRTMPQKYEQHPREYVSRAYMARIDWAHEILEERRIAQQLAIHNKRNRPMRGVIR